MNRIAEPKQTVVNTTVKAGENSHNKITDIAETEPRISYPCYKSFDEFIDIQKLKSLDAYIAGKIEQRINRQTEDYFLNAYRLDDSSPHQPGAREIWLSKIKNQQSGNYDDLDNTELWELTKEADEFPLLINFIKTLPFNAAGRILIIYDDVARPVPAHRDHNEKKYVESYSAWFDSVNQFHGTDPYDGLSFSIRVDGVFTDEFKDEIPKPEYNLASTPSFWACVSKTK